jgi:predicted transcriptional regulator
VTELKARGLLSLITFSEKRSNILLLLQEESKTLEEIKRHFKVTSPEILPRLKELEKNNLIYQEDKYALTDVGEVVVKRFGQLVKTLKIFEKDMGFWSTYKINRVPEKFRLRIYEVGNYTVVKSSPTEIFKPHEEYMKNLIKSKWIKGVSPVLHPEYPNVYLALAENGVKISLIVTGNVLERIKKKHRKEFEAFLKYKNVKMTVCKEKIEVAFTVTDSFLSMRLFLKSGEYDFYKNIISYEKSALMWGEDLFSYYEKRSEKVEV